MDKYLLLLGNVRPSFGICRNQPQVNKTGHQKAVIVEDLVSAVDLNLVPEAVNKKSEFRFCFSLFLPQPS